MPSPRRPADLATALRCRHFGTCGGCSRLDVPYEQQAQDKVARVRTALAPFLGNLDVTFDPPPRVPRYDRIDLLYPIHPGPDGLTMGLYRRGSHRVEALEECRLQAPALTEIGVRAAEALRASNIPPYREQSGTGILRAFRARYMPGSGELLLGVVTTRDRVRGLDALAASLADCAQGARDPGGRALQLVGVVQHVHGRPGNALMGVDDRPILGRSWQRDRIRSGGLALDLQVSFASFYQSHRHAGRLLYDAALDLVGDVRGAVCTDGYGGVGGFGVRLLARGADRVTVVESHPTSARDAIANARQIGAGMHVEAAPFPAAPLAPSDLTVVDPPRAGLMEPGIEAVLRQRPDRMLYVACSIQSLARDLGPLTEAGYGVRKAHAIDLFPHTDHVETAVLLER